MVKDLIFILIFSFGMFSKNTAITKVDDAPVLQDAKRTVGNDAYLWTAFFNKKSNSYLISLLNDWNIKTLFLAVNPTMDLTKLQSFQILAHENGIQVDFLIGENSYAEEEDGYIHLEKVMITGRDLGFKGIHLDIEPHTFDDYNDRIDAYSKMQINLFEKAKKWTDANGMDLSVSVPMYLPVKVARTLGKNDIVTHIMAYGNLDVAYKLELTRKMRKVLKTNSRWVFELDDFADYKSFLVVQNQLIENGITEFTFHDVEQMDKKKRRMLSLSPP